MTIAYYLVDGRINNLYMRMQDGAYRATVSLKTPLTADQWDNDYNLPTKASGIRDSLLLFREWLQVEQVKLTLQLPEAETRLNQLKALAEAKLKALNYRIQDLRKQTFLAQNQDLNMPSLELHLKAATTFLGLDELIDYVPFQHQLLVSSPTYTKHPSEVFGGEFMISSLPAQGVLLAENLHNQSLGAEYLGGLLDTQTFSHVFAESGISRLSVVSFFYEAYDEAYNHPASQREWVQLEQQRIREFQLIQLFSDLSRDFSMVEVASQLDRDYFLGEMALMLYQQKGDSFITDYLTAFETHTAWQKISLPKNQVFYAKPNV